MTKFPGILWVFPCHWQLPFCCQDRGYGSVTKREPWKQHKRKERLKAQIIRTVNNPEIGNAMRYSRKHRRDVYISPFRLSYCFDRKKTSWFSRLFTTRMNNNDLLSLFRHELIPPVITCFSSRKSRMCFYLAGIPAQSFTFLRDQIPAKDSGHVWESTPSFR